jgi:hypothetical protein
MPTVQSDGQVEVDEKGRGATEVPPNKSESVWADALRPTPSGRRQSL